MMRCTIGSAPALLALVLAAACGGATSRSPAQRSTLTANDCSATAGVARNTPASVVLTIASEPAAPPNAEANLRINGELSRSDISVPINGGARLDLAAGVYDMRLSARGYETAERKITLTAGCQAELSATLRR